MATNQSSQVKLSIEYLINSITQYIKKLFRSSYSVGSTHVPLNSD